MKRGTAATILVILCGLGTLGACMWNLSPDSAAVPPAAPAPPQEETPPQANDGETALPAGGGDPGKVWDAFDAAMRGGDVAAVKKLIIKSRVQDVTNELWKSFVMVEFRKFKNPAYVSGVVTRSGKAEIRYKASETAAGRRNTREAHLQMEDGVWKVAGWD